MKALPTRIARKPKRRMSREAVNFIAIAPAAAAKVSEPDSNGDRPKPICSSSGIRNGIAPMPSRNTKPPTTPAKKVGSFNRSRSRIASGVRRAWRT